MKEFFYAFEEKKIKNGKLINWFIIVYESMASCGMSIPGYYLLATYFEDVFFFVI